MWVCPNGHKLTEVIASLPDSNGEMDVLVDAETGEATNRFYDGIVGVPDDLAELAEADESPMCPECLGECDWV
jgi:hypothetical protein